MKENKLDKFNLRKVILQEAEQIKVGLSLAENVKPQGDFKSITISGMGGSALPADILDILVKDFLRKSESQDDIKRYFEIYRNRTYHLPEEAYDKSLNVVCSYSGNTEETISSLREVVKNKLPCVALSNGGMVEKICQENNIPHIQIPYPFENFQPRIATGYFVFAIWKILQNIGIVGEVVSDEIVANLEKKIVETEEYGQGLAQKIFRKTPIVYSTDKFKALAMVWKIKFNENSKTPAFWNYFSEVNHNEMVGFTNPQADFHFIMLRDKAGHPQNIKRMEVMAKLLKKNNLDSEIIDIEGGEIVEKVFSTLYLGDWVSYYLALEYETDPTPVQMVEEFKKLIK
ncbi:MAG TPA: bifunctional phosphoglucose/phosphomannose isomerase [Candidatus Moranbacteria bacterium]|nr:bifunctional phosphoglucose/phosphomannose isomerase [Candidatus Moranbacteria bacterium]